MHPLPVGSPTLARLPASWGRAYVATGAAPVGSAAEDPSSSGDSSSPSTSYPSPVAEAPSSDQLQDGNPSIQQHEGLWREVQELRELLHRQGGIIDQQQETIRNLEVALSGAQPRPPPLAGPTRALLEAEEREAADDSAAAAAAALEGEWPEEGSGVGSRALSPVREFERQEHREQQVQQQQTSALGLALDASIGDRRLLGGYDARFHSTESGATPRDFRLLPRRIVLVRHAQSEGNVDNFQYTYVPDPKVPLTARGWEQAIEAGETIRQMVDEGGQSHKVFFYTSPYLRSKQTYEGLIQAFEPEQLLGVQEEVQLREQDFGNFQDAEGKKREKAERLRFGRFFYRFPNGESGADVYDRMTIFEDHLVRDINAGRFGRNSTLVLVTHGLAARIFLMRWFHWTVDQFMNVFNPPNAEPIVMERVTSDIESRLGGPACWIHTKALYRLTDASMDKLVGCTEDMCSTSWLPRGIDSPRQYSSH